MFYACFNAVNNNDTNDVGDETYYTTLMLTPSGIGINELEFLSEVSISPNPSSGEFFVKTEITDSKEFSVFTVQGKLIQSFSSASEINKIDLKNQPKGLYFIKISSEGKTAMKKIIISGEE